MQSIWKYIIIILVFCACNSTTNIDAIEVPKHILSEEKMIEVLTDITLAESASSLNINNVAGPKFDSTYAFNPLKENNVTPQQFDSALSFYTQQPKKLRQMYDKVLENLSKQQAKKK